MTVAKNLKGCKYFSNISEKFSAFGNWLILILCLLIFGFLALQSLLYTTAMYNDPNDPSTVIFMHDNFYINLAVIAIVLICGLLFLKKLMTKINPKIFGSILLVYTFVLGLIWNMLTQSNPAHDSYHIVYSAQSFAANDYTPLMPDNDYFYNYPFQLGYAFVCEIIFHIFDNNSFFVLQLINILSTVAIFSALLFLTHLTFKSKIVLNFTIFFLFGCIQPILFTTFHYGNLLGFAFSMWAIVFTCLFIKNRRWFYIIFTALFIAIGVMCKSNSLIVLAAICILLLLDFLKCYSWVNLLSIIISIVMGVGLNSLIIFQYEQRADVSLGGGVPKILWLDMGLHETSNPNRPGWYNPEYTVLRYASFNRDEEAAAESGKEEIKERVGELLSSSGERANFFATKTLSQWNDPLYMSIWVCATRPSRTQIGPFVESMYTGNAGIITENYANVYQSLVFIFAAAGTALILKSRNQRRNIFSIVLPLVFLGGFFYHLLFEAMPQYNVTYFTLFIPLAAYGFSQICKKYAESFRNFFKERLKKKKQTSENVIENNV